MGRLGVTYEQFSEAANQVLITGQFPTIEKVRLVLGVGSNTTLNAYMNRWKDEFIKNHLAGTKTTAIPDPVQRVINDVWHTLQAESKRETEQVQAQAQAAVKAAQEAQAAAEQKATALQEHLNKLSLDLNHTQANVKMLQDELTETRKRCAVAEERTQASEHAEQAAREEIRIRLAELEQFHHSNLTQLDQQFKAREAQYQQENRYYQLTLEEQRQKAIVELDHFKIAKTNAEKAQLKARTELGQQVERYKELAERTKTVEFDLTLIRQHQQEAEKALIISQTELRLKDAMIAEYQQKIQKLTEHMGQLKTQIKKQT